MQIAAQVLETSKSPMWCAMKLARGLKTVRSDPRCFISFNWFDSIVSRSSSSVITRLSTRGFAPGSEMPAICALRQLSSAFGAVV